MTSLVLVRHGQSQWRRRSFDVPPPALDMNHEYHPSKDKNSLILKTKLCLS